MLQGEREAERGSEDARAREARSPREGLPGHEREGREHRDGGEEADAAVEALGPEAEAHVQERGRDAGREAPRDAARDRPRQADVRQDEDEVVPLERRERGAVQRDRRAEHRVSAREVDVTPRRNVGRPRGEVPREADEAEEVVSADRRADARPPEEEGGEEHERDRDGQSDALHAVLRERAVNRLSQPCFRRNGIRSSASSSLMRLRPRARERLRARSGSRSMFAMRG